ncbi:hypothetical protein [Roseobacter sp. GAI101]|uniref:hypothetical protein n=1 Tax=Roseobacter sp. (strain GAI101) TaxID=391589 RepID=UPI000569C082|nr:hypothetical protein [Roseobacter sp. GAI101]
MGPDHARFAALHLLRVALVRCSAHTLLSFAPPFLGGDQTVACAPVIPEHLASHIDMNAIARDLACYYSQTEIAGQSFMYRAG